MANDSNLQFIREKIYQVRSAIMYSMSDEVIKIPNSIVTAVRVDDEGQLWFLCKKPLQFVSECEQNFPARLKFYRKGISFFLEVSGKATIVNNNSNLNLPAEKTIQEKPVLIKMAMTNIEYVEPEEKKKKTWVETTLENSYKWFLKNVAFHRHSEPVLSKLHQSSI
ncbi:MAG TPA: hypothetical protein VKC90_04265 [Chitinophagaceae bacterium]|nr:hypothetical protein [Chitinophagaceae bacterium]